MAEEIKILDPDILIDQLLIQNDENIMPIPNIEYEPHLLISKVRKHYMEYLIKLISINYENNQKLVNKNIYLPSAIWRCAKYIEMSAAQTCMVVQLYRRNILAEIKKLKIDTKNGRLNRKLYECLHFPPKNEIKTQTSIETNNCNCPCTCNLRSKRRKVSDPSENEGILSQSTCSLGNSNDYSKIIEEHKSTLEHPMSSMETQLHSQGSEINNQKDKANVPVSLETKDSDELMMQLEKLFQSDSNDDLFESILCESTERSLAENKCKPNNTDAQNCLTEQNSIIKNHEAQIKSLDERLVSISGLLANNTSTVISGQENYTDKKTIKNRCSKWLCEEYFQKEGLFDFLDNMQDVNRKKFERVKIAIANLFGDVTDDNGIMSPLNETPEFITSCKERIAPWVVKTLTPSYVKGRIRGKALFKAVAKHLIKLIFQCSPYPSEYEVHSFVSDFLENHSMIRCEADFKQFKIDNV